MPKVTIAQIAKALKLSPTTVSFVLNDRDKSISEATRKTVIEKALSMGYRKLAKVNMIDWTRIAYVTSNIQYFNFHTSFFAGVYSHLQRKAMKNKMELFLLELDPDNSSDNKFHQLQAIRNLGIEICLTNNIKTSEYLEAQGIKTILAQGGKAPGKTCIYCDDYTAGKIAAEHAFEKGHREAGMIFPNCSHSRLHGFIDTFLKLGGTCPEKFRWFPPIDHEKMTQKLKALSRKKHLPTFFYCFADHLMFPAIKAFASNGLKVPDDISLIGTDNLYWGKFASPSFTTIDLNEELFAEKVIEAVAHLKKGAPPYQLAVPVRLMERETVKDLS